MNPYQAALGGLIASTALFYGLSLAGKTPATIRDFFHDDRVKLNAVSLTVANLALASTLAFILDGTKFFGALYLIAPIALYLGQYTYGYISSQLAPSDLYSRGTLIAGLNDSLDAEAGRKLYFQCTVTITVGLTYIFALAYEIFVSAKLLSAVLSPNPTTLTEVIISLLVMTMVMIYTLTGGYKTVQKTDCAQFIFSIIFLLALSGLLISLAHRHLPHAPFKPTAPRDPLVLLGFATLVMTPFTAQVYGILNHTMASHQSDAKERARLFKWSRLLTVVLLLILSFAALYYNTVISDGAGARLAVIDWIVLNAKTGDANACFLGAFVSAGMGAIIMSTVDTILITTTQASFEGLWNKDSRNTDDLEGLRIIRFSMGAIWPVVFIILGIWWYMKPDTFSLLFAVASPCEALAPLIITLLILAKRKHMRLLTEPSIFGVRYIYLFYCLMALTLPIALYGLAIQQPWTKSVGFCSFILSSLLALPGLVKSKALLRVGK